MGNLNTEEILAGIKNWVLGKIGNITALIPTQASSSNQLADKAFVNSSVSTATATHRGTYNLVTDLELPAAAQPPQIVSTLAIVVSTADRNDYVFVQVPTADATPTEIARVDKYKYNGTAWAFEYTLNNSGYTAAQWAAINSGITSDLVTKLGNLPTADALAAALLAKEDKSNKVTSITSSSTDTQYGSAKAVWTFVTGVIDTVKEWAQDLFAKQDGLYETMGVGTAVNLAGQTERTDDAMYRKSGGSEEVASGTATIANIKGNTVAWNQLAKAGSSNTRTIYDVAFTFSTVNGVLKVSANGTPTQTFVGNTLFNSSVMSSEGIEGHKYYARAFGKCVGASLTFYGRNVKIEEGYIYTYASGQVNIFQPYLLYQSTLQSVDVELYLQGIDLTFIYGAGNEPTTVEEFEADYFKWFGKPLTFEDYDAGSLRSVQLDAMKTTGFNQFDEQFEKGTYNSSGVKINSNKLRNKNLIHVVSGEFYWYKSPISCNFFLFGADAKTIVGMWTGSPTEDFDKDHPAGSGGITWSSNSEKKIPSDCRYIAFSTFGFNYTDPSQLLGQFCINLSNPSKNGTYEPYEEHVASIPVTTLKGKLNGEGESVTIFPDGMKSAGTIADEIYTVGDKTYAVKRVGSVDLGSLGWSIPSNTTNYFVCDAINGIKTISTEGVPFNIICDKYVSTGVGSFYADFPDKKIGVTANNTETCVVKDTTYSDASTFKTAMQGVMLYYELETPQVYELDTFDLPKPYQVDNNGTEEQIQKSGVQGLAAILTCIYGVDAVGILNKLPQNYVAVNESQQFTELQKAQARNNIGAYSKPDNGIPVSDINLTNLPEIGIGYGICTTDTYEASKVVAIPNFLLIQEATINVLFTTPINSSDTTLNVNDTGAKTIKVLGNVLPSGIIKAQSIVTFVYYDNAWNIVNIFCPDASFDPATLVVDMGLPSGTKWAARDIDLTKPSGFCDTPFTYEKSFFSWGNIDGHNPISTSAFYYNWGSVNGQEPYYEGQPYGSTPGNTLTGNIAVGEDFDAARANLGAPWRMPTNGEYGELFANIIYINADGTEVDTTKADKRVTVNGIMGLYIQSKINGARLFFSCSGYGGGSSWNYRGSSGGYWSSTFYSSRDARYLSFNSGGVYPQSGNYRYYGFAVRAVQ